MSSFTLPGFIQDFPPGSPQDVELNRRWNINAESWIQQAMPAAPSFFYDPSTTPIPNGTASALVEWFAFPGRLGQYYSSNPPVAPSNPYNLSATQIYSLADTGFYTDSSGRKLSFQRIPSSLCPQADWGGELQAFGPYGPRGWLDEYCEWSTARDGNGNIVRVDFACENPEYWYALWSVDPQRVQQLYQSTLNYGAPPNRQITVNLSDLLLIGQDGRPVVDPQTGRAAYNPLNKWNSGPNALRIGDQAAFTGGVMHLTSTPNTLQTELGLAGAATPQYQSGNSDVQKLICCGQYGQEYRNSDPHIGYSVNRIVGGQGNIDGKPRLACLANPVGLYIQAPDLSGLAFGPNIIVGKTVPAGAKPADIFQIVRGSLAPIDPVTAAAFPGDMLLHVAFQIPLTWLAMTPSLTLADLLINGQPIQWGGQIATQMQIGLFARPLSTNATPPVVPCAGPSTPWQPLHCMYQALWNGYYPIQEPNPSGQSLSLASNTVIVPPWIPANGSTLQLLVTCNGPIPSKPVVTILNSSGTAPDPAISVAVTGAALVLSLIHI